MNHYPHKTLSIKPDETALVEELMRHCDDQGHLDLRPLVRAKGVDRLVLGLRKPEGAEVFEQVKTITLAPEIRVLHLWHFRELQMIQGSAPELYQLDTRNCANLTSLPPLSPALLWLDLGECPKVRPSVVPQPAKLEFLFLDGCLAWPSENIHALLAAASGLQSMRLDRTEVNGTLSLQGNPDLQQFFARACPYLDGLRDLPAGLATVVVSDCPELKEISPIPGKTDPSRRHPGLTFLDISGCSALGGFSFLASARALRELRVDKLHSKHRLWRHIANLPELGAVRLGGSRFPDIPDVFTDPELKDALGDLRRHFQEINSLGAVEINECKVLLLGNGAAGKTCLSDALVRNSVDLNSDATHGIRHEDSIRDIALPDASGEQPPTPVRLRIWDFGGQDLYHSTHRIFMRTNAVHVVVWAEDDEATSRQRLPRDTCHPLHYWLDQILSLRPDADIVLVRNKADRDGREGRDPRGGDEGERWWRRIPEGMRDRLQPHRKQIHALSISCAEGRPGPVLAAGKSWDAPSDEEGRRFRADQQKLRKAVHAAVSRLLGAPDKRRVSKLRAKVQGEVERLEKNTADQAASGFETLRGCLSREAFDERVKEWGASCPTSQDVADTGRLLGWLHNTGSVFQLKDRDGMAGTVIYDQTWVLRGIYSVFQWDKEDANRAEAHIRAAGGWFKAEDLLRLAWRGTEYEPVAGLLLDFMEQCGVVVKGERSYERWDHEPLYFAPQYAPEDAPADAAGLLADAGAVEVSDPHLGRDVLSAFTAHAVAHFGRAAQPWLRTRRLDRDDKSPATGGVLFRLPRHNATAVVAWTASADHGYGGTLRLAAAGEGGAEVLADLAQAFETLPAWPSHVKIPLKKEPSSERQGGNPGLAGSIHAPVGSAAHSWTGLIQRALNSPLKVAFSFAGKSGIKGEYAQHMPGILHERIKQMPAYVNEERGLDVKMARTIAGKRACPVCLHVVQFEASDDPVPGPGCPTNPSIERLCRDVAEADFPIILLSGKYWQSPYCLYEFVRIFERFPRFSFQDDSYFVAVLEGGSLEDLNARLGLQTTWMNRMKDLVQTLNKDSGHDANEYERLLRTSMQWFEAYFHQKFIRDQPPLNLAELWCLLTSQRGGTSDDPQSKAHNLKFPKLGLVEDAGEWFKEIQRRMVEPANFLIQAYAGYDRYLEEKRALEDLQRRVRRPSTAGEERQLEQRCQVALEFAGFRLYRYWMLKNPPPNPVPGDWPPPVEGVELERVQIPENLFRDFERDFLAWRKKNEGESPGVK